MTRRGFFRRWMIWLGNAWRTPAAIDGDGRVCIHMLDARPRRRGIAS